MCQKIGQSGKEMDKFLDIYALQKLNHKEIENLKTDYS